MSIEQQLVRDIAAVAGGVIVTDSEMLEARKELNERIQGRRTPGRTSTAVAAAAAAIVLVAAGIAAFMVFGDDDKALQPADQGPVVNDPDADFLTGQPPTAPRIAGIWRVDNGAISLKFTDEGKVSFDEQGTLFSRPVTSGTYVIKDDVITISTTQDAQQSCIGSEYAMRASLPRAGEMRFVSSTTVFGACSPMPVGQGTLEQVLPVGPAMADLVFSTDSGWQPVTERTVLHGLWMAEGGRHVLELDANGVYYIVDSTGTTVDSGAWSFGGTGLTLRSSAGTQSCRSGDKLVLGAVEYEAPNTRVFRGTVKQNPCGAPWTPAAWILLRNDTTN
jgi:hypothetical protein